MKNRIITLLKMCGKSVFYLVVAMIILILINEISESDFLDPHSGSFWKKLCSEQISIQADNDEDAYANFRTKIYQSISPNQEKIIIEYEMSEKNNFYASDRSYLGGKNVLAVQQTAIGQSSEQYIYVGQENMREPQWLDNDHVFFTVDCGSDCETIYLLNVNSKELRVGTLTSIIDTSPNRERKTFFTDWYGKEFTFTDRPNTIRPEIENNKTYLIFELSNIWAEGPSEKRFMFTGHSLILQNR